MDKAKKSTVTKKNTSKAFPPDTEKVEDGAAENPRDADQPPHENKFLEKEETADKSASHHQDINRNSHPSFFAVLFISSVVSCVISFIAIHNHEDSLTLSDTKEVELIKQEIETAKKEIETTKKKVETVKKELSSEYALKSSEFSLKADHKKWSLETDNRFLEQQKQLDSIDSKAKSYQQSLSELTSKLSQTKPLEHIPEALKKWDEWLTLREKIENASVTNDDLKAFYSLFPKQSDCVQYLKKSLDALFQDKQSDSSKFLVIANHIKSIFGSFVKIQKISSRKLDEISGYVLVYLCNGSTDSAHASTATTSAVSNDSSTKSAVNEPESKDSTKSDAANTGKKSEENL